MGEKDAPIKHKYWAFISYSWHDRRITNRLIKAISQETVPLEFRHLIEGNPRTFSALFLDRTVAAAGSNLSTEIREALSASNALIVVCSPFAVSSTYVSDEISYFRSLDRGDRIFCVIASGIPNATDTGNPQVECFPRELRYARTSPDGPEELIPIDQRPLAASLGDETSKDFKNASDQISAGLLDVSQSELRALRSRSHLKRAIVFTLVCLTLLSSIAGAWDYFLRERVVYFSDFVRRDGIWEGIREIGAASVGKLNKHYAFKFVGRDRKPVDVRILNSSGRCHADGIDSILGHPTTKECSFGRACIALFSYGEDGSLQGETLLDQYGEEVESMRYLGPSVGTFVEAQFPCREGPSGITNVVFERHEDGPLQGLDRKITFLGNNKESKLTRKGAAGFVFERRAEGRLREVATINPNGDIANTVDGYARLRYEYDGAGNEIAKSYRTPTGELTFGPGGFAERRFTFDEWGNATEMRNFDITGNLTLDADKIAGWSAKYNDRGMAVKYTYVGIDEKNSLNAEGVHEEIYTYDESGNLFIKQYTGVKNEPTSNNNGVSREELFYNGNEDHVASSYFKIDRQPSITNDYTTGWRYNVDSRGSVVRFEHFGLNGSLTYNSDLVAYSVPKMDEKTNRIETAFFGVDGKPTESSDGTAGWRARYDSLGNLTEQSYFGLDGRVTRGINGTAGFKQELDDGGNGIKETYFGPDGSPSKSTEGFANLHVTRNAKGQIIEQSYFDEHGRPTVDGSGVHKASFEFDEKARSIGSDYFNIDGKHTLNASGYAGYRYRLDEKGRVISVAYFGTNGEPIASRDGIAGWKDRLDDRGNIIEEIYLDTAGRPTQKGFGYAAVLFEYDERDRRISTSYLNEDLKQTSDRDGCFFIKRTFNTVGKETKSICLGEEGTPILRPDGSSGQITQYSPDGDPIAVTSIGPDGRKIVPKSGIVETRKTYDTKHRMVLMETFGISGLLTDTADSSRVAYSYDKFGKEIERRFIDALGRPLPNKISGRAIVRTLYDDFGREIEEQSLSAAGDFINRLDEGWALKKTSYASGHPTVSYFSADGSSVDTPR